MYTIIQIATMNVEIDAIINAQGTTDREPGESFAIRYIRARITAAK